MDLIPSRAGEPASSAIAQSVELAQHVEQLGYKRYWVAEHQSIQGLVCSATPVLIGHITATTKKIRVGSGGVMLPNHRDGLSIFDNVWEKVNENSTRFEERREVLVLISGTLREEVKHPSRCCAALVDFKCPP